MKRPPDHLSAEMKKFWRSILAEYELEPDAALILRTACEQFDRAQQARAEIERDGLVADGNRRHAACDVEKTAVGLFLRSLRQLGLDVVQPGSGKPAGKRT